MIRTLFMVFLENGIANIRGVNNIANSRGSNGSVKQITNNLADLYWFQTCIRDTCFERISSVHFKVLTVKKKKVEKC